jgi:hypothetical protein
MLQMPLPRMVSVGRSILNTGELGNSQNVPPASVGICHFPALPPQATTDSGLTLAGPARARGGLAPRTLALGPRQPVNMYFPWEWFGRMFPTDELLAAARNSPILANY